MKNVLVFVEIMLKNKIKKNSKNCFFLYQAGNLSSHPRSIEKRLFVIFQIKIVVFSMQNKIVSLANTVSLFIFYIVFLLILFYKKR